MEYSYRFRIYPTEEQEELMTKTFGSCRYVFNYFLNRRKTTYNETGRGLSFKECCRELTSLKKALPWLKEVDSTALQAAVQNLDKAYTNFFRGLKTGCRVGYPQFKARNGIFQVSRQRTIEEPLLSLGRALGFRKLAMWTAASASRSREKSFLRLYNRLKAANTMLLSTARM